MTMPLFTDSLLTPDVSTAELSFGREEKKRGAIFTKQSVVDFILDLVGYIPSAPLYDRALLEPSFGSGRFLFSAVDRLMESWRASELNDNPAVLVNAIRAVELDSETFTRLRAQLLAHLVNLGSSLDDAEMLCTSWLVHDDFLWTQFDHQFDFVIGNPPYVRQELIDPALLAAYRQAYPTMVGRADLYVAFIERSLDLLRKGGKLSFICADAWVKNEYGRGLRKKIAGAYNLSYYVDMYGVDAFESSVGAYPSITVIANGSKTSSRIAKAESADANYLRGLQRLLAEPSGPARNQAVIETGSVTNGADPWLLSVDATLPVIRHMEAQFPTLSEAGCHIGIGVATGADKAFIAPFDQLDVEKDRKLPLATNRDVPNGQLSWSGKGIVNPYSDAGPLVDLSQYPKLSAHLEKHRALLEKRHTAKGNTAQRWYKTIDRITPSLTWQEKLLIPDIKGDGDNIAYDPGTLYPHHNLYFITSSTWNLRALQALLRSGVAHLFVEAYSVKIGGGYLRFQAQNLKRIRVPHWSTISVHDQDSLISAGEAGRKIDRKLLERIYQLNTGDLSFLREEK